MTKMNVKSRDDKIRDFCKLQHACQKLSESLNVIYDLGISHEELEELANSDDTVDQALAISPCMSIASYMKSLKDSVNLTEIYKYYEFNANETPVDEFITMKHITPLPSSSNVSDLNIDTNDVVGSTNNNSKQQNQESNFNHDKKAVREFSAPMRKGKNLDPSLAGNNNQNSSKQNQFSKKGGAMNNNNKNKNKNKNNNNGHKRLDPALGGTSSSYSKNSKSSNKYTHPSEEVDNEASAKLHAALGKYSLAPDYSICQLPNGSFEATCKIKGMNKIICKGYGRNKKAAQHNAATSAFTSQELIDLLSSRS